MATARTKRPLFRQSVGARIRALRRERGLSIEALAERADIHANHLGLVERGGRSPTIDIIERIARGLDVSPSALLDVLEAATLEELRSLAVARLRGLDAPALRRLLRSLDAIA
jgi:transcriptional regulator with XRE-family HTH domain